MSEKERAADGLKDGLKERLLSKADRSPDANGRRGKALAALAEMDFPTTKDEDWRFTSLRRFLSIPFEPAGEARLSAEALDALEFARLGFPRAVFVNGRYAPGLSDAEEIEAIPGLSVGPAERAPEIGAADHSETNIIDALNAALSGGGTAVRAERGKTVETPIHLVYITAAPQGPIAVHPRTLLVAEENSRLTAIESHLSLNGGAYFTNPVTEAAVKSGASIDHYKLQLESEGAFHLGSTRSIQDRDSSFETHTITLGAGLLRNDLTASLDGPGGSAALHAFYLATGEQHVDHFTTLIHARENCVSREVYKGVLDDASSAVFHGRIHVKQDAQETDSYQHNANLLLTKQARANSKPQLEIYADQVKCSHGATVGQIDEEALFYLRSRGIGGSAAHSLLIYAFASEVVDEVKPDTLRDRLQDYIFAWLPEGSVVREAQ